MDTQKRTESARPAFLNLLSSAIAYVPEAFDFSCKRALRLTSKAVKAIADSAIIGVRIPPGDLDAGKLSKFIKTGWCLRLQALTTRAGDKQLRALKKLQLPELRRLEIVLLEKTSTKLLASLDYPQLTKLKLTLRPDKVTSSVFPHLSNANWPLQELSIHIEYDRVSWQDPVVQSVKLKADTEIVKVPSHFPLLRKLTLSGVKLDGADIKALTAASLPNLEYLEIEEQLGFSETDPGAFEAIASGNWPLLQDLNLSFSFDEADRNMTEAFLKAPWFNKLKSLTLSESRLSRSMLRNLLDALKEGPLEKLHLGFIDGVVLVEFKNSYLPNLRQLTIKQSTSGEARGEDYLNLEESNPIDEGEDPLSNEDEEEIEAHVGISAIFESPIAETLEVLSLEWLGDLGGTPCTWAGVSGEEDMYSAIYGGNDWRMPNLKVILLKGLRFESTAMLRLGRCLVHSSHLERICLGGYVMKNGLSAFVAGLPHPVGNPAWPRLTQLEFPVINNQDEERLVDRSDVYVFLHSYKHFPALKSLVIETGGQMKEKEGRALGQAAAQGAFPHLEYLSIFASYACARAMLNSADLSFWNLRAFALGLTYTQEDRVIDEPILPDLQAAFPRAAIYWGHFGDLTQHHADDKAEEDSEFKNQERYLYYYRFKVE